MELLFTLIGLVMILEGLPYLVAPESMQRWLRQILLMPPRQIRQIGGVAMAAGFLLCYIAQKTSLFN